MKKAFLYLTILSLIPSFSFACSAFKYAKDDKVFVAKNFDWHTGIGYLIKNSKDVEKCSYFNYNGRSTCWTSTYGSVTFNQNGKEFPYGGINEAGLVVEMLWLNDAIYPEDLSEASQISELEWIQYQLDNYATVEQVLQNLYFLQIDPITARLHYFVVDQTGNSAVIEFIEGVAVVSRNEGPVQVITNSTNAVNSEFYNKNKSKLGDEYLPKNLDSRLRFCALENNLNKRSADKPFRSQDALSELSKVKEDQASYKTYWQIVYDLTDLEVSLKTYDLEFEISFNLNQLEFDGDGEYFNFSGEEVTPDVEFVQYTDEDNMKLINTCIKPNMSLDYARLNEHQMMPEQSREDDLFNSSHKDVMVFIQTKTDSGFVNFFLSGSEEGFKQQGPYGGRARITGTLTSYPLYNLPTNKSYAFGAFHDLNSNGYMDRNFLKIPKEPYSFSASTRFFFFPPKFKDAKFPFTQKVLIDVE